MLDFVRGMIALRRRHPSLSRERFLTGTPQDGQTEPDIAWHGIELNDPSWGDGEGRSLAFTLPGITAEEPPLHVMLNMHDRAHDFAVPQIPGRTWRLAVDTAAAPALYASGAQTALGSARLRVEGHAVVVLEG
jgi:glycogen operon protein